MNTQETALAVATSPTIITPRIIPAGRNIMLDLETLSSDPGGAIVTLGAVSFDYTGIRDTFYARIDLQSCIDIGLHTNPATILWWMGQGYTAQKELTSLPRLHINEALRDFAAWALPNGIPIAGLWGNGATFDNVLLSEAYRIAKAKRPWSHRVDKCYRTVKNQFPGVLPIDYGTKHDALDDAVAQTLHLLTIANLAQTGGAYVGFRVCDRKHPSSVRCADVNCHLIEPPSIVEPEVEPTAVS